MVRVLVLFGVLLQVQTSFADEPNSAKTFSSDEVAKLVDRIEQLEKRIEELENRPRINIVPQYQQNGAQNFAPRVNPFSTNRNNPPSPGHPKPFSQNESSPKIGRPFLFNGIEFYIVPVDTSENKHLSPATKYAQNPG